MKVKFLLLNPADSSYSNAYVTAYTLLQCSGVKGDPPGPQSSSTRPVSDQNESVQAKSNCFSERIQAQAGGDHVVTIMNSILDWSKKIQPLLPAQP